MVFRSRGMALLVAILAAGLVFSTGRASAAESGKPALRVAVVDFSRVLSEYKKTKVLNEKMEKAFGERRVALGKRMQEIANREKGLRADTRPKDDPGFAADAQQLNYDMFLFENDRKALKKEMHDFTYKHMKRIIAEIDEAVRRFAVSRGYDLVLRTRISTEEPRDLEDLTRQIAATPVLYFSSSFDISDSIIALLNTAYDRGIKLVPEKGLG